MEQGTVAWHRFETLEDASQALAEAVAIRLRVALEERGAERGYLVGVQIERMSVTNRASFNEYVQGLKK